METVSIKLTKAEEKIIEDLFQVISNNLSDDELTRDNIVIITVSLMKAIEKYKSLSGEKKKLLVCCSLKCFIEKNMDTDQLETQALIAFVENLLPSVIDTVINVDKQKIKIKVKNCFLSCANKN